MENQEDKTLNILGHNIAERRKALGYKNAERFAEDAGISISGLRDIERGVSEGRTETRLAIARALKCDVADLYLDPKAPPKPADIKSAAEFLVAFAALSPAHQKVILALIYKDPSLARGLSGHVDKTFQALLKAL